MSDAVEIIQQQNDERDRRAAQRSLVLARAEHVLTRLDATTYNAAIAADLSRPLTGQLAREEHVVRALIDVMQELRKATASSDERKQSLEKGEEIPDDRDKTVAQVSPASIEHTMTPIERVRRLLKYEQQLGQTYVEHALSHDDVKALLLDAERYQALRSFLRDDGTLIALYHISGSVERIAYADTLDRICDELLALEASR